MRWPRGPYVTFIIVCITDLKNAAGERMDVFVINN